MLYFFSSTNDWKLTKIAFVRFLHCVSSIGSHEFSDINRIFASLLGMSKMDPASVELIWSIVSFVITDFIECYGRCCSRNEIQIVEECFKRLTCCVEASVKSAPGKFIPR